MSIFQLHTNEGQQYVRSTQERLRKAMYEYIREKRAKGYALSDIMFCWSEVRAAKTI